MQGLLLIRKILKEKQIREYVKQRPFIKKVKKGKKISFSLHMAIKRGFIATIRELVSYAVTDKILCYEYKYEHPHFNDKKDFKTDLGYMKYIAKTNDVRFNIVANDLEAKHFNGLKTFVTFNTHLYRFTATFSKAKPLRNVGLLTKRLEGLYPKQKEGYNITGGNREYHTIEVMTNPTDKRSTYSNIFTCFVYLRAYVISMLSKINHLLFRTLFKTVFVRYSKKKRRFKVLLNGFRARLRPRRKFVFSRFKKFTSRPKTKRAFKKMLLQRIRDHIDPVKTRRIRRFIKKVIFSFKKRYLIF